jgi:glycosyltransferase involved in cell wall biosynthesis
LKNLGYDICVHTLSVKGTLAPRLEEVGIRVICPPFADKLRALPKFIGHPILLLLSSLSLILTTIRLKPATVHFFLPEAYLVGGIVSYLVPNIKRVMSRRSLRTYQARHPFLARIERWLHHDMDAVLGNSQAVCNELIDEGVTNKQVGLIYNGLDLTPYAAPFNRWKIRHQLGIPQDGLVLSIVANLIPYKGHTDFLGALGAIKDNLPTGWIALCIGRDAGILPSLQQRASELGIDHNVIWLGSRADVPDLLRISDIGILCSHEEGFSNAILEGMAANLPMIVTDVGGNKEAVVDEHTGYVVPPRQPDKLSEVILKLANDPQKRKSMGKAGRERLEHYFSLDSCANRYSNLYAGLLNYRDLPVSQMIENAQNEDV